MAQLALDAGFQQVEVVPTAGMPGVFATLDAGAPKTLGVYFMYDVKQYDPKEWSSPPLEARLIDKPGMGKIIMGRGAVNQKGPEAAFLAALHAMKDAGRKLPVNLVLVAEGEEEIGSPHFGEIVNRAGHSRGAEEDRGHHAALRQPGHDRRRERRARREGHRGAGAGVERRQMGPRTALGPALEPTRRPWTARSGGWSQALQTLVTPDGNTPAVDGWYEHVKPLTARQKELIAQSVRVRSEKAEMKEMGISHWIDDCRSGRHGAAGGAADDQHRRAGRGLYRPGRQDDPAGARGGEDRLPSGAGHDDRRSEAQAARPISTSAASPTSRST